MIIIDYKKKHHKQIIDACVLALAKDKVIAYPTDTSYGLAVDTSSASAIKNLYRVKGRSFDKAVSVVVPSVAFAKKIVEWPTIANKLSKKFWPGAVTLVSKLKMKNEKFKVLSASTNYLGLRMPKNNIAMDLAKYLKAPITATSANVSGKPDCYCAEEIVNQYKDKKIKPDIILNAGKLPKRKPSTIVKLLKNETELIREGGVSYATIKMLLKNK